MNIYALLSRVLIAICAILIVLHCCAVISLNEITRGFIIFLALIASLINYKIGSKKKLNNVQKKELMFFIFGGVVIIGLIIGLIIVGINIFGG